MESVDVDGQDQSQHLNHQSNAKKWKGNGVCGIMNVEKMVFVSNLMPNLIYMVFVSNPMPNLIYMVFVSNQMPLSCNKTMAHSSDCNEIEALSPMSVNSTRTIHCTLWV